MNPVHVVILALVQGLTELLPVSSSAHVIVTARLLHEDMSTPANALLLVLLHTGTMFAVIAFFWRRWAEEFFSTWERFWRFFWLLFAATLVSGLVGYPVMLAVEHRLSQPGHAVEIETLFNRLNWIAPALAAAGILILWAGLREARRPQARATIAAHRAVGRGRALFMGILQGLAIPFRGFSRSGVTISGGLLGGGERSAMESFSFAMAVAITPLAIGRELWRLHTASAASAGLGITASMSAGLLGMACAFVAGLLALRWLSRWLEMGRWYWFGAYCLAAAAVTQWMALKGGS